MAIARNLSAAPKGIEAAKLDLYDAARQLVQAADRFQGAGIAVCKSFTTAGIAAALGADAVEMSQLFTRARTIVQSHGVELGMVDRGPLP